MIETRLGLGLQDVKNVCNTLPMTTTATAPAADITAQLATFSASPAGILDEARGWVLDCWEDVEAWDMSELQLGRIIARHYDGGIPAFITNSSALITN